MDGNGSAPSDRGGSAEDALETQRKRRKCCICNREVLVCLYAAHVNNCVLAESDSDVEVVNVFTGAESKALKAASCLLADNDSAVVGSDVPTGAENEALKAGSWVLASSDSDVEVWEDDDHNPAQSVKQKDENTSDDAVTTATGAENESNPEKGQDDVPIHDATGKAARALSKEP